MNIFYLEIWCFKGLAVWQEVSTWSDVIRPPPVCLFVYRCWGWLGIFVVVVVVVGGEQRAPFPLAGPGGQRCPPQANSGNYRKGDIKVKGHWVNRLVQWWCIFTVLWGCHSPALIVILHITAESPASVTQSSKRLQCLKDKLTRWSQCIRREICASLVVQ